MALFDHEKTYRGRVARAYKRIAQIVQGIISRHVTATGQIDDPIALRRELASYGDQVGKWAQDFWGKLLPQQQKLLERDWKSKGVRLPAHSPSVQAAIARAQAEQVDLIKTLPRTAAEKAQEMAEKAALETGDRSDKLIAQLQGLEPGYPEFAARRLARTEIAKSQSLLVEAQAKDAGVTHYVWCTMRPCVIATRNSTGRSSALTTFPTRTATAARRPDKFITADAMQGHSFPAKTLRT